MIAFETLELPLLAGIFMVASAAVWWAGVRLSYNAGIIADRTGLGQALIGVVLLGFATSLPEVATTTTASLAGNPAMAVNNLLGGVAFQILVLAVADMMIGRKALTSQLPTPRVMLYAVISIAMLALVAFGVVIGDLALPSLSVGVFPLLTVLVYVAGLWAVRDHKSSGGWKPVSGQASRAETEHESGIGNLTLALSTIGLAALILVAGYAITRSAETGAAQLGLNNALIGLTLIAAATSLPELSTAIAAVRLRRHEMAIGDVLGGNLVDIALIVLVDLLYIDGLALHGADPTALAAALLAIVMTALILFGMIERRDRTVLRMGYDSAAVILVYLSGVAAIILTAD
jgi:cation:H+ antiporter